MSEKPSQHEKEINSLKESGGAVDPKVNKPYEPLHKEFNNIMEPKLLDSFHCTCIAKWIGITLGKSVKNIKVSIPEYQSRSHGEQYEISIEGKKMFIGKARSIEGNGSNNPTLNLDDWKLFFQTNGFVIENTVSMRPNYEFVEKQISDHRQRVANLGPEYGVVTGLSGRYDLFDKFGKGDFFIRRYASGLYYWPGYSNDRPTTGIYTAMGSFVIGGKTYSQPGQEALSTLDRWSGDNIVRNYEYPSFDDFFKELIIKLSKE